MARGTIAQQAAQGVGLIAALVITTALARDLALAEFGLYGLVVSTVAYLSFAFGSAEAAVVRSLAATNAGPERDRVFTAAVVVYAGLGLAGGALLAAGGAILVSNLGFHGGLEMAGRLGALGVGVSVAIGWPLKLLHVVLRSDQRFIAASAAEAAAQIVLAASTVALIALGGPLWLLITLGSSIPLLTGICAAPAFILSSSPVALAPRKVRRQDVRDLVAVSSAMLGVGAADVVITSLDRIILGAFRSPAALGLYEGAIRPNNVVRAATGAFSVTLLPVLARLKATRDPGLERALVLRGTRYMLAGVVPPTAGLIAFAEPILRTWLGEQYAEAWVACSIFLAWWLVSSNAAIAETSMFVEGRLRRLATLSWATAGLNLVLSLGLTPLLGLEGVALGTTLAYVAILPFWVTDMLRRTGIGARELAVQAWLPAYAAGAVVVGVALAARAALPLDEPVAVFGALLAAVAVGWAFLAFAFSTPDERRLARELFRS
jgi:O-antigen/teichoic acid export membrane protein